MLEGETRQYPQGITMLSFVEHVCDPDVPPQQVAAWLGQHNLPIFPIRAGHKGPATKNGWKDATTDVDQIDAWWPTTRQPRFGIGCVPGDWGCLVVDIDTPKDGEIDGTEWWTERFGNPHLHPHITQTPSGGLHLWFKAPGSYVGPKNRTFADPNGQKISIDFRCDAGYVVWQSHPQSYKHFWDPTRFLPTPVSVLSMTAPVRTKRVEPAQTRPLISAGSYERIDTDEIKRKASLDFLASEFGGVVGDNMVSCPAPDHPDLNPSAQIALDKGGVAVWTCFKCQIGGDLISFYMTRDSLSFIDAAKAAQDRLGISS